MSETESHSGSECPTSGGKGGSPDIGSMWNKSVVSSVGIGMAKTYREQIMELVQPNDLLQWYASLLTGVRRLDRTCMRLYAEMLKIVDPERDLVNEFVRQLGYERQDLLVSVLERTRIAQSMDEESLVARSEKFLREFYARKGKRLLVLDSDNEVPQNGNGKGA